MESSHASISSFPPLVSSTLTVSFKEGNFYLSNGQKCNVKKLKINGKLIDLSQEFTVKQIKIIESVINQALAQLSQPNLSNSGFLLKSLSVQRPSSSQSSQQLHDIKAVTKEDKTLVASLDPFSLPAIAYASQSVFKKNPLSSSLKKAKILLYDKLRKANSSFDSLKAKIPNFFTKLKTQDFDIPQTLKPSVLKHHLFNKKDQLSEIYKNSHSISPSEKKPTPKNNFSTSFNLFSSLSTASETTSTTKVNSEKADVDLLSNYSHLLESIANKEGGFVLHLAKGENQTIQIIDSKKISLHLMILDKKSKTAFKEIIRAAQTFGASNPAAALELLNNLKSSTWGAEVLKISPHLKKRFEDTYQTSLSRCVSASKNQFAGILLQVTEEELLRNAKQAGNTSYEQICPHLFKLSTLTNSITNNVVYAILSKENVTARKEAMKMYLQLAHQAYDQKDFSTFTAILASFESSSIHRLNQTNEDLQIKKMLEELKSKPKSSPDKALEERKFYLQEENFSSVPFLGNAFFTPLLMNGIKPVGLKDTLTRLSLDNKFIEHLMHSSSSLGITDPLDIENKIINQQRMMQSSFKGSIKSLQTEELKLELEGEKKAVILKDQLTALSTRLELDLTPELWTETIKSFVQELKSELADLKSEMQTNQEKTSSEKHVDLKKQENLTLQIKVAESWSKVINQEKLQNLKIRNLKINPLNLLNLIYQNNLEAIKINKAKLEKNSEEKKEILASFSQILSNLQSQKSDALSSLPPEKSLPGILPESLQTSKQDEIDRNLYNMSLKIQPAKK